MGIVDIRVDIRTPFFPAARGRAGIASTARQAGDGQAHLTKSICPCAAGRLIRDNGNYRYTAYQT